MACSVVCVLSCSSLSKVKLPSHQGMLLDYQQSFLSPFHPRESHESTLEERNNRIFTRDSVDWSRRRQACCLQRLLSSLIDRTIAAVWHAKNIPNISISIVSHTNEECKKMNQMETINWEAWRTRQLKLPWSRVQLLAHYLYVTSCKLRRICILSLRVLS